VATALFFAVFHERYISGFDPGNFVLALRYGYDPLHSLPHAPGYPGFYLLWKLLGAILPLSSHHIILLCNAAFSLLAIVLTYTACIRLFDRTTARIAAVLAATNTMFLYYGCSAELYAYDSAFSAFVVLLLTVREKRREPWLFFLYGLLGAFRLSSVVLTLPVVAVVLILRARSKKEWSGVLRNVVLFIVGFACWFAPFLYAIGGWKVFTVLVFYLRQAGGEIYQTGFRYVACVTWMLNIGLLLCAVRIRNISRHLTRWDERYLTLLLLIAVPSTFFVFQHIEKGYTLLCLTPLTILMARTILSFRQSKMLTYTLTIANLLLFFIVPFQSPPAMSGAQYAKRTMWERWSYNWDRSISYFAPTLAHLQFTDARTEGADRLIQRTLSGSYIFVDQFFSQWVFPRALQTQFPDRTFLLLSKNSLVFKGFSGKSFYDEVTPNFVPDSATCYCLIPTELRRLLPALPGTLVDRQDLFELYAISASDHHAFFEYLRSTMLAPASNSNNNDQTTLSLTRECCD